MTNGRTLIPWADMNLQISSTFLYSSAGCQSSRWNSVRGYMCFWQMCTWTAMWSGSSGFVFAWFLRWGDVFVYHRVIVASTGKNQPQQRSPGKLRGWHCLCISNLSWFFKKMWEFFFLECVGRCCVVCCQRSGTVPHQLSVHFHLIRSIYTLHVSRSKSCWFLKSREKSFFSYPQRSRQVQQVSLMRCDPKWKKMGQQLYLVQSAIYLGCNFYVIENILQHFNFGITVILWNIRNSTL